MTIKLQDVKEIIRTTKFTWRLRLLNADGAGILELVMDGRVIAHADLEKRYVHLLLLFSEKLANDKNLEEYLRGWLTAEQVANLYSSGDPKAYTPQPSSLSNYRSRIYTEVCGSFSDKHARAVLPPLFVTVRNVGARLIKELEIVKE